MQQLQKLDAMTYTEELDASLLRVIRSDAWRSSDRWVGLDLHDLTVRSSSGGNSELVARRLNHFFRLGVVKKEFRRVNGKRVAGILVPVMFNGRTGFTHADNTFLRECGIQGVWENDRATEAKPAGAVPPLNKSGATACAAAF
jgi:hypothetical protein